MSNENGELLRQNEDLDQSVAGLSRQKAQLLGQVDEARRNLESETREKHAVSWEKICFSKIGIRWDSKSVLEI